MKLGDGEWSVEDYCHDLLILSVVGGHILFDARDGKGRAQLPTDKARSVAKQIIGMCDLIDGDPAPAKPDVDHERKKFLIYEIGQVVEEYQRFRSSLDEARHRANEMEHESVHMPHLHKAVRVAAWSWLEESIGKAIDDAFETRDTT